MTRDAVIMAGTIASIIFIYMQVTNGNLNRQRIAAWLDGGNGQPAADPVEITQPHTTQIQPPRSQRPPSASSAPNTLPANNRTPIAGDDRDVYAPRNSVGSPTGRAPRTGNLAPLVEGKPPASQTQLVTAATIPLDVSNGRQMAELPGDYDQGSVRVSAVAGFPQSATILPREGALADGSKVEICPFGDKSVYLIAQIVEPTGESARLMIEAKTSFDWIGGERLTDDRLRRKRTALVKQANLAAANRAAAAGEIANLVAYVQSHTVKPLRDVGKAKDRIAALQRMLPGLDSQAAAAQQQVVQFDQFCKTLGTAFKDAAIVLAVDPPPVAADATVQVAGYEQLRTLHS